MRKREERGGLVQCSRSADQQMGDAWPQCSLSSSGWLSTLSAEKKTCDQKNQPHIDRGEISSPYGQIKRRLNFHAIRPPMIIMRGHSAHFAPQAAQAKLLTLLVNMGFNLLITEFFSQAAHFACRIQKNFEINRFNIILTIAYLFDRDRFQKKNYRTGSFSRECL